MLPLIHLSKPLSSYDLRISSCNLIDAAWLAHIKEAVWDCREREPCHCQQSLRYTIPLYYFVTDPTSTLHALSELS